MYKAATKLKEKSPQQGGKNKMRPTGKINR
jgi:hypothetical protein